MVNKNEELVGIITKFAQSGWDAIDAASKAWLELTEESESSEKVLSNLVSAIEKADQECGNCGCEFDPLYKRALVLLQ